MLAYMTFSAQHRAKLHSTNPIERRNGEIKRRKDVAGIFPNKASIRRPVGAILMEQTEEWTVRRGRYMTLKTLTPVCDPAGLDFYLADCAGLDVLGPYSALAHHSKDWKNQSE